MTTATNAANGFDGFDLKAMFAQMHARILENLKMGAARASEDVSDGVKKGAKWANENLTAENARLGAQWSAEQLKRGAATAARYAEEDLNQAASIMGALWEMLKNLFERIARVLGYMFHGPSKLTPAQTVGDEPIKSEFTPVTDVTPLQEHNPEPQLLAFSGPGDAPTGAPDGPGEKVATAGEGMDASITPLTQIAPPDIAKGVLLGEATKIMDHFVDSTPFHQLRVGTEVDVFRDLALTQMKPLSELAKAYLQKASAAEQLLNESIMEKAKSIGKTRNFESIKDVLLRKDTLMAQMLVGDGWKDLHAQNEAITQLRIAANRAFMAASTLVSTAERLAEENPSPELIFNANKMKTELDTLFATEGIAEMGGDNSQEYSFALNGTLAQNTKAQTALDAGSGATELVGDRQLDPLVEQEAERSPLISGEVFRFQDGKMSRQPVPMPERLKTLFDSGRDSAAVQDVEVHEVSEIKDGQRQG